MLFHSLNDITVKMYITGHLLSSSVVSHSLLQPVSTRQVLAEQIFLNYIPIHIGELLYYSYNPYYCTVASIVPVKYFLYSLITLLISSAVSW
jgi:hypothetical protein